MLQVGIVFFVVSTIVLVPFIWALRRTHYLADVKWVLRLRIGDIRDCKNGMVNVKLKPFYEGYYVVIEKAEEGKTRLVACRSDNSIIEMYFDSGSIFVEQGDIPTMHTFEIKQKGKDVNEKVCVIFLPDDKMLWDVKTSIIKEATNQG